MRAYDAHFVLVGQPNGQRPATTAALLATLLAAVVLLQLSLNGPMAVETRVPPGSSSSIEKANATSSMPVGQSERWGFGDPVVLVGDSLTEFSFEPKWFGFGLRLQAYFSRRNDVLNRGSQGITSQQLLSQYNDILTASVAAHQSPAAITIWVGTNDIINEISVENYVKNLKEMVKATQIKHPSTKIVIITPPPVSDESFARALRSYRDAALQLAKEAKLTALDTWQTFLGPNARWDKSVDKYFYDGVHFNSLGHDVFFKAIKTLLP
ncbi:SGNH hydrolase-type esterase domain-containing protein [Chytriomyces sp. MP71]|nr:SGNH hydrolase-type esterase domain-containing protein [Chytriomyces sp. MP71]